MAINWQCPFCNRHTTIADERQSYDVHHIQLPTKLGNQAVATLAVACPNDDCKELYLLATMSDTKLIAGRWIDDEPHTRWPLRPQASVRQFPPYVPEAILEDYSEACLIAALSPKASATLARRCLQGMIRDFWKITKGRLVDEVDALKDKVDASSWEALDAVRTIGNIGAHMEKDVNVIVEIEPHEAELLLRLIETLIEEWYVDRHEREQRMKKIVETATMKDAKKQAGRNGNSEGGAA